MLTEGCAGRRWEVSSGGAFGVRPGGGRQPCRFISSSLCSGIFRPFIFLRGHKRAWRWPGRRSILLAPRIPLHRHMWLWSPTAAAGEERPPAGWSGKSRVRGWGMGQTLGWAWSVRPGVREAVASSQPGKPWLCEHWPQSCVVSEL